MQQQVIINDVFGNWALNVHSVYKKFNNTYAFKGCNSVVDLTTGKVNTWSDWRRMLCNYALEEGYEEQNISAQCKVLYEAAIAAEA